MTATQQIGRGGFSAADPGDWLAALQQHEPWLRKVLFNRVGDRDAVDDLMQEIGMAISRPDLRPTDPDRFGAWLYRVAIKQAYLYRRKMGRLRKLIAAAEQREQTESRPAGEPLQWLLGREHREAVREAMQRLSDMDREILMLKYAENWTYQQLADRLGVTVHTIEHRLLKAKSKLRRLLNAAHVENAP